jgi:serine/threonine-protein kinase
MAQGLGVDFVGECSVQKYGDRIRLIFQLLDGRTGSQVWAGDLDRTLTVENLFDIQSDIAQQVAHAVGAMLTGEEQSRIEAVPTQNLEAYEAYMLGRYYLNRRLDPQEAFSEAERYLQIAIREDPDLAVAHAALAEAYALMAIWGFRDPREILPEADRWARSALAIDNTVAEAHSVLAQTEFVQDWNWVESERRIRRALELSPSDPDEHRGYTEFLLAQGRIEEARQQLRIATALDPLSSPTLGSQVRVALYSRRYEEADGAVEVLLTRDPENTSAAWALALPSLFGGDPHHVARLFPDEFRDTASLRPGQRATRAVILSLLGEAELAKTEIQEAASSWEDRYFEPRSIWRTYAVLGAKDEAFYWMGRSIDVQSINSAFIGVTPFADPLRDDPRYQALLDRIGLGHLKARFDSLAAADPRGGTKSPVFGNVW